MAKFLYRTGRFCAAHALFVLLAWIVLAIGLTGLKAQFGVLTSNDQTLPGTQSQQASDLLATYFPHRTMEHSLKATGTVRAGPP